MAALEREIAEQVQKLTHDQQQRVLEFARGLVTHSAQADWEHQPWSEDELRELLRPKLKTGAELAAWLESHSPPVAWGNLGPEDDAAEYVHHMRREQQVSLDTPDESVL